MPPVLPLTDDSANPLPWSSSTKSSKTKHNRQLLSACLMATLPHKAEKTMGPDPCKLFVSVSVRAALKFTDVAENSLHGLRFLIKTRAKTIQRQIHVNFSAVSEPQFKTITAQRIKKFTWPPGAPKLWRICYDVGVVGESLHCRPLPPHYEIGVQTYCTHLCGHMV